MSMIHDLGEIVAMEFPVGAQYEGQANWLSLKLR